MNEKNAELISGLMDSELDEHAADTAIRYIKDDSSARQRWLRYHFISDVIKGHTQERVDSGFAERISTLIENEPAILVPQRKAVPAIIKHASGFAVAATVAIVAILAVQPDNVVDDGVQKVASTIPSAGVEWIRVKGVNWNIEKPAVESKLNAYLVNHNGYSNGVRGILPYAPIVSYNTKTNTPDDSVVIEYQENVAK
jgi:sigma-E factor negative regulatory protein RseA